MSSYLEKLLSQKPSLAPLKEGVLNSSQVEALSEIKTLEEMEAAVVDLRGIIPVNFRPMPSFGEYSDYRFCVKESNGKFSLLYCERGGFFPQVSDVSPEELIYDLLLATATDYCSSAVKLVESLDRIDDQRLILWIRMSSQIRVMFETHKEFGKKAAKANVKWMSEELVRMGVEASPWQALQNEQVIIKGLMLSGITEEDAGQIYSCVISN